MSWGSPRAPIQAPRAGPEAPEGGSLPDDLSPSARSTNSWGCCSGPPSAVPGWTRPGRVAPSPPRTPAGPTPSETKSGNFGQEALPWRDLARPLRMGSARSASGSAGPARGPCRGPLATGLRPRWADPGLRDLVWRLGVRSASPGSRHLGWLAGRVSQSVPLLRPSPACLLPHALPPGLLVPAPLDPPAASCCTLKIWGCWGKPPRSAALTPGWAGQGGCDPSRVHAPAALKGGGGGRMSSPLLQGLLALARQL